jgi:hypothetical protein
MNAFETAEITAFAMSNFLATFGVFLSIATAYLAAAFLVGNKLSSLQLAIVNGSYLIATSILGFLVSSNFRVFFIWASSDPNGLVAQSPNKPFLVDFTWPLTMLLFIIVIGSFAFMYSIRKGSSGANGT